MKHCVLILLMASISLSSFSQQSRHQGATVILQSGDSVSGFIANESLNRVYKTIKFKQTEGQDFKTLSSTDVIRFTLADGDVYESYVLKYDGDSQNANKLTVYREPQQWTEERIFIRVLAKGPVSLFDFEDPNGRVHFFLSKNDPPVELLNREYRAQQTSIGTNKKYIGQLRSYFLDCSTAIIHDNLKYDSKALVAVVNKYYTCIGFKHVVDRKAESVFRFGVSMDFYSEKRNYTLYYNFSENNYSLSSIGLIPGLSVEIRSSKPYKRFSFYGEIKYKQISGTSELQFKESSLEILLLPRFNYLIQHNKKIFWNIGASSSYVFNSEIEGQGNVGGLIGGGGLVVGAGFYLMTKEKLDLSLECRGKYGFPTAFSINYDTYSCIGIIINVVPKFRRK